MTSLTLPQSPQNLETIIGGGLIRKASTVILGSLFLAAMSQIEVPFFPVPMTLQTLAVMLIGLTFGFRLATLTVTLYLVEGAAGLPVFAGFASGPAVFVGGTAGYLVGFLAAAAAMGFLVDRGAARSWPAKIATLAIGEVLIFGFGIAYLTALYGFSTALEYGLYPFVAADLLKMVIAALLGTGILEGVSRYSGRRAG